MKTKLRAVADQDGWTITASKAGAGLFSFKAKTIPYPRWEEEGLPTSVLGAAFLRDLKDRGDLNITNDGHVKVSFREAAQLGDAEAAGLGFPPPVPYQLDLKCRGAMGESDFSVTWQFIRAGVRVHPQVVGSAASLGDVQYRIPDPIFSIVTLADELASASGWGERVERLARLRSALPEAASQQIGGDRFLFSIRIAHASAFGLDVRISNGEVEFDPIPLGSVRHGDSSNTNDPSPIMPPSQSEKFTKAFRNDADVQATYVLERGSYLYIDPDLRAALEIVKKKQRSSPEERIAFLMSPRLALKRTLLKDNADELLIEKIENLFIETAEYTDRILAIGEWQPPNLPFMEKEENNWLPERFSIVLGGKLVTGEPTDIDIWLTAMKKAEANGAATANLGGVEVPVSSTSIKTLTGLLPPEVTPLSSDDELGKNEPRLKRRFVYQTQENFEAGLYARSLKERTAANTTVPNLRSELKPHQVAGFEWLVKCYLVGWPGILLADDMGLGKTLQALAFLAWLKEIGDLRTGRPALIVAPTSLLRNWQNEHDLHLLPPGLGQKLVAYGTELSKLRLSAGMETDTGSELLDTHRMREADWILTTYETLRDYQFSFARIPFSCMILDEVQKAKNPASRTTSSLKSVTSGFSIAMTGTPVENSLSDLWSITDIVAPGLLPSLKEFAKAYGSDGLDSITTLSRKLLEEESKTDGSTIPSFALRRMKSDIAAILPIKHDKEMLKIEDMKDVQADKYADFDAQAQAGRLPILRALHDFRSISLHPIDPSAVGLEISDRDYISASARFRLLFDALKSIRDKGEKALVFLHSRKVQSTLSVLIKREFGCKDPMIIRGDVPAVRRQEIVDEFSALRGFAVLILSPKAAGVGLNITAANHVIHLDRWWNPAVEDQCTDRAYRIGQQKPVWVYALAARHPVHGDRSYDIILHRVLERKRELSRSVFTPTELRESDFSGLISQAASPVGTQESSFLEYIDSLTPLSFEEWVNDKLVGIGLMTRLTRSSGDGGADLVVRDRTNQISHLIQCKFTTRIDQEIDGGMLTDIGRMRSFWKAPNAMIVGITNARDFSAVVRKAAAAQSALLIARKDLSNLDNIFGTP